MPRWKLERTLIDTLDDPFLEYDRAMITIAAAFGSAGGTKRLWDWLDDAGRPLFTVGRELRQRAAALTDLMSNQLCLTTCTDRHQALLLDHVITSRRGHPLLLACVGRELARRAGWPSVVAATSSQHVTVLTDDGYFTLIAYGTALATDATCLRACCPHETTVATLTALAQHAPADLAASATRVRDQLQAASHEHTKDA